MKRKTLNVKNLEADVSKAISKHAKPNQAMIDYIVNKMVADSDYKDADELHYSLVTIDFEVKYMIQHALNQTFGG